MITTRLDSRQRAALRTLTSDWETGAVLIRRTTLYRSGMALSMALAQMVALGLVERREQASRQPAEWRITDAGLGVRGPIVAEQPS